VTDPIPVVVVVVVVVVLIVPPVPSSSSCVTRTPPIDRRRPVATRCRVNILHGGWIWAGDGYASCVSCVPHVQVGYTHDATLEEDA